MIVTEEEAKTKRCQESFPASDGVAISPEAPSVSMYTSMASAWAGGASAMAVTHSPTAPFWCLGSNCMAWRWAEALEYEIGTDLPIGMNPAEPGWEIYSTTYVADQKKNRWRRPKLSSRRGFCGKAGQP